MRSEESVVFAQRNLNKANCGSPPGVIVADTLSFNAKIGVVDF